MPLDVARAHGKRMVAVIDHLWADRHEDLAALILAYATIDAFAILDRPTYKAPKEERTPGAIFRAWVDRYFLPETELSRLKPHALTAQELWLSRCGLLHGFTPDAYAREEGDRRILFLTGSNPVWKGTPLNTDEAKAEDLAIVGPHQVFDALGPGIERFLAAVARDEEKLALVSGREGELYRDWVWMVSATLRARRDSE